MISLFINVLQKGERLTRTLSESLWSLYYLLERVLPLNHGGAFVTANYRLEEFSPGNGEGYCTPLRSFCGNFTQ